MRVELRELEPGFDPSRLPFAEHHQSHVASAFFPSPFDEAVVLTADGSANGRPTAPRSAGETRS